MKDLAEFCVEFAKKNGAEYSEARFEKISSETFTVKNGTVESPLLVENEGIGMRIIADGVLSFLSFTKADKNLMKEEIKKMIRISKSSSKISERSKLSKERVVKKRWKIREKIKIKDVDIDEKISLLLDLEKNIRRKELPSRFFQLTATTTEKFFINSEGTRIHSSVPNLMLFYNLVSKIGNQTENRYFSLGSSGGWEIIKRWNLEKKIKDESKMLVKLLKGKTIKTAKMDVILAPELVGIAMHESCGHPAEADRILGREGAQAGESYLKPNFLGMQIGTKVVTVVDDPRIKGSYGYYEYDDEGVKARRRFLIKNGLINEFLHNRETANKFGIKSNAAARASSFDREPIVRMSTTFMLPGDFSLDELIEDVKHGVYIKSFTEWNIDDKRWNQKYVGCEAYEIVNGKIKGLVRRPVLELTTKGFFSSVDACGKDLDFVAGTCGKGDPMQGVPVWMGGPHIRLRNVVVKHAT